MKTIFNLTDPFGTAPFRPPYTQSVSTGEAWFNMHTTHDYTLGQLLDQTIVRCGVQDAIVYADRDYRLTWFEFGKLVDDLGRGLMAMGVKRNEKIALWATNVPLWVPLMFAAAKIGAVLLPLNTNYKTSEIEFALTRHILLHRRLPRERLHLVDGVHSPMFFGP
jgi:non-ribosomal peptide synthetase component E (peptide arylation enzyme)